MGAGLYGYARVSTKEQNEDRQVLAMMDFGVPAERICVEKMSGKDFDRPVYRGVVDRLEPGDALVVKSLDRLGRDYEEILAQWRRITGELGADIVVIDMPLLDTRQRGRGLTASFVSELVLQILSYVAQQERAMGRQRQSEGIAAAKGRGVRFGRKPRERPEALLAETAGQWRSGQITSREAGRRLGVSHSTFLRWARET